MTTASPYCPGCFRPKPPGVEMCGFCGFDESEDRSRGGRDALPLWARLQGRYLLGRVLDWGEGTRNRGEIGITYLAWDLVGNEPVSVEEFFPSLLRPALYPERGEDGRTLTLRSRDEEVEENFRFLLTRFMDAARIATRFDHLNLARVKDCFQENGAGYMVMEHHRGMTLREYLEKLPEKRMSEAQALAVMRPVMDGLREAHRLGVLHQSIEPAVIHLADWKRPVLSGFGAFRNERWRMGHTKWFDTAADPLPDYMPPENFLDRGRLSAGPWTDVYACAAVLYRLVSGVMPASDDNDFWGRLMAWQETGEDKMPPRPLAEVAPGVGSRFDEAVRGALALDPKKRPRSVGEFLRLLNA